MGNTGCVVAGLVLGLATMFGGCCGGDARRLKRFNRAEGTFEHYRVSVNLHGMSHAAGSTRIIASPYHFRIHIEGNLGEEGDVTLKGVKLYDGARLAYEIDEPIIEPLETRFDGKTNRTSVYFRLYDMDIQHKLYQC